MKNITITKWILILAGFDLITKLAFYLLSDCVFLNPLGFGGDYERIFKGHNFAAPIILISALSAITFYLALERSKFKMAFKILGSLISFPIVVSALVLAIKYLKIEQPDSRTSILFSRIALTAIVLVFYLTSELKYFKWSWALMFSGSFSNTLSFLYPPYKIIDFIYFPTIYEKAFNCADVFLRIGWYGVIGSFVFFLFSKLFLTKSGGSLTSRSS